MLWESEAKRIILPGISKRGFTECQIAVWTVKHECVCTLVCGWHVYEVIVSAAWDNEGERLSKWNINLVNLDRMVRVELKYWK